MNRVSRHILFPIAAAAGLFLATLACSLSTVAPTPPSVIITFPQPGTSFPRGREVVVQSVAAVTDGRGIARIELWADGQIVNTQAVNPPTGTYTASQPWLATVPGSHILEVRAYNLDNVSSNPAQVVIVVTEEAEATPLVPSGPIGGATPGAPTPGLPAPASPPPGTAPVEADVDQVASEPSVTAVIGVNVRSGPGVEYAPPIGWLAQGQTARITGRNADGTWWQIEHPSGTAQRGWVSARPQYTTARDTENVPVVAAPPLPTATPTPTPTPTVTPTPTATPTLTPNPMRPVIFFFQADRYSISPGENVTLRWDLANADSASLRYDDREEGVVAPGVKVVAPERTTVYTLVTRNASGTVIADLTITVGGPSGSAVVYDLMTAAPAAAWSNGTDALPWDGSIGDPRGFAKWRDGEQLEDGSRPSRVLQTHPEWVSNGSIIGTFTLPAPIQAGDRFKARVGFLAGVTGDARFLVGVDGGALTSFRLVASVDDAADGVLRTLDADLSTAAGGQRLWLVVQAGSSAEQDQAVWVNPRIER
jgi:uncharacterized protein YraI